MNERITMLFEQYAIKCTPARLSILAVLQSAPHPFNYEQIKDAMSQKMDKATFYRNIALFEEKGMVHKFEADDRKWYFELGRHVHAHFICDKCHHISCVDVDLGPVEGDVKSIVLKGTCKECQA